MVDDVVVEVVVIVEVAVVVDVVLALVVTVEVGVVISQTNEDSVLSNVVKLV